MELQALGLLRLLSVLPAYSIRLFLKLKKVSEEDFLVFDILKYDLSKYNLSVYDYSKFNVDYHYNEEFTYDIILNLELKEEKEDYIEIYKFTYNFSTDEINDYKTIFYRQS